MKIHESSNSKWKKVKSRVKWSNDQDVSGLMGRFGHGNLKFT